MTEHETDPFDDPVPPSNLAAERACLGAMLLSQQAIEDVASIIGPGEYYRPIHGVIHSAITAAYAGGTPTDAVAVAAFLADAGDLRKVGGGPYLHGLLEDTPNVASAGYYAGIVADLARQRRVDELGLRVRHASRDKLDTNRLTDLAAELASVARAGGRATSGLLFQDGVAFTTVDDRVATLWGDQGTPVWAAGESLMLFGPPGIGKSTLIHLLVFARMGLIPGPLGWDVVDDGGKVLYLAMDRPQQIARAMVRLVEARHRVVLSQRLQVWRGPLPFDLTKDRTRLADICGEMGATTVVIDSLKDCVPNPSDEEAAGGYNLARQVALSRGIQWIEGHHNRKGQGENKTPNTLDDVYGNRWLTAGAGTVLCLWGTPGDPTAKLIQLKSPGEFFNRSDVIIDFWQGKIDWAEERLTDDQFIASKGREGVSALEIARLVERLEKPTNKDLHRIRARLDGRIKRGSLEGYDHPSDGLKRWRFPLPPEPPPPYSQEVIQL